MFFGGVVVTTVSRSFTREGELVLDVAEPPPTAALRSFAATAISSAVMLPSLKVFLGGPITERKGEKASREFSMVESFFEKKFQANHLEMSRNRKEARVLIFVFPADAFSSSPPNSRLKYPPSLPPTHSRVLRSHATSHNHLTSSPSTQLPGPRERSPCMRHLTGKHPIRSTPHSVFPASSTGDQRYLGCWHSAP